MEVVPSLAQQQLTEMMRCKAPTAPTVKLWHKQACSTVAQAGLLVGHTLQKA